MKKILFLTAAVAICLTSCDFKTSKHKQLEQRYDSLLAVQQQQTADLDAYLTLIEEVEAGFDTIRDAQNFMSVTTSAENTPMAQKERIQNNMAMINAILEDNNNRIAELEAQVEEGSIQSESLKRTIAKLRTSLKQKTAEIEALMAELEAKNFQIDSLTYANYRMTQNLDSVNSLSASQQQTLAYQDSVLNTGYVLIATRAKIRELGVDVSKLKTGLDNKAFVPVDIRETKEINTASKSATILTKHPKDSYTLEKNEEKMYVLKITNAESFWSVSKYLVIRIR